MIFLAEWMPYIVDYSCRGSQILPLSWQCVRGLRALAGYLQYRRFNSSSASRRSLSSNCLRNISKRVGDDFHFSLIVIYQLVCFIDVVTIMHTKKKFGLNFTTILEIHYYSITASPLYFISRSSGTQKALIFMIHSTSFRGRYRSKHICRYINTDAKRAPLAVICLFFSFSLQNFYAPHDKRVY